MTAQLSCHGRLTSDPGGKQTANGKDMAWARMVCNLPNKDSDSGESPLWIGLLAFGRVAEQLQRHSKGDMLSASGTLQASSYTNQQGQTVEGFTLMVDSIVSSKAVRPGGRKQQGTYSPAAQNQQKLYTPYNDKAEF